MASDYSPAVENAEIWTYETDHHIDHGGADIYHHVVAGERHVCEVQTEADALRIVRAVEVVRRVESLVEDCERKAAKDRDAVEAGGLTVGECASLTRRADNYDLVADGLRRALVFPPAWPCDNYTGPNTCLTVGCTTPCDQCRSRSENRTSPAGGDAR